MAFHLEWTLDGEKQLSRKLIGLQSDLKDYTKPFSDSAFYLKSIFSRDVFESQGAAIGEKWKRLSPYTVAQKARTGLQEQPLINTGNMRASFVTRVSPDQAVIANTADYFKYHQSKDPRSSNLPRRVMMKLNDELKSQVVRYFQAYIREAMRK